jgi:hypothetical protein
MTYIPCIRSKTGAICAGEQSCSRIEKVAKTKHASTFSGKNYKSEGRNDVHSMHQV